MKNVKYFLFSLLCMVCSCVVFAKDEITIEKMIPVYDENSGVIVAEENGIHSVIFNDKDQNVKYNIVLKNNTKRDISLKDIVLPESPEEFFKYELVGIDDDTVLEPDSTEEVVLSLETVKTEGWGRNFTLDLTSKVEIMDDVVNPNTSAQELIVRFVSITFIAGIVTICLKNKKVSRYVVLVVMFGSLMSVTNAKDPIILPIKLNVSFESQNVMKASSCSYDDYWSETYDCNDFWVYNYKVKNFFIENEIREISEYVYKYDVSDEASGKVIAYLVENAEDSNFLDLYLMADGIIYMNEDASYYFACFNNVKEIFNIQGIDSSNVTNMSFMFCDSMLSVEHLEEYVNSFDTSKVTDMSFMFYGYSPDNDNVIFSFDNLNTSNVKNMKGMFQYALTNSNSINLDLTSFDTSKVTDMSYMFMNICDNSEFCTLDLSNFDTSKVTDMSYMFINICNNGEFCTLDLSNFDTSNVTDMSSMFYSAGYSSENFTLDVSGFDTSNVMDMSSMFQNAGYNNPNFTLDVSSFNTSNVMDMSCMFWNAGYNNPNFTLDVSSFNTGNVTDMAGMFNGVGYNSEIFDLDTSNFDMSKVNDVGFMFNGAGYNSTKLNTSITINKNNFQYEYDYRDMFKDVAIKPGTNITVNYTSETEALVDQMIATKTAGANVVKGVMKGEQ